MYDYSLAIKQRDIFLADQDDSEQIIPEEWERRPWSDRMKESVARVFSQVL